MNPPTVCPSHWHLRETPHSLLKRCSSFLLLQALFTQIINASPDAPSYADARSLVCDSPAFIAVASEEERMRLFAAAASDVRLARALRQAQENAEQARSFRQWVSCCRSGESCV